MIWNNGKCYCGRSSVENRLRKTKQYDPKWTEGRTSVDLPADRDTRKQPKCSAYIGQMGRERP